MIKKLKNLVQNVISQTGLSVSEGLPWHGSDSDYSLGWYGRRASGIPKNFYAIIFIVGRQLPSAFSLEVGVYGYNLRNRGEGFSRVCWSRTLSKDDLDRNRDGIASELKRELIRAWKGLPRARKETLLARKRQKQILEQLKKEGK